MPTVPTSSFNVAPQALPGAQVESIANADDFGGAAARQTMQLGDAVERIGTQIQQRTDADQLFRAETSLKADASQFMVDQAQRKGVNAWDMTKDANKWWDDAGPKYGDGLSGDAQRAFAKTLADARRTSVTASSMQEANERRGSLEESSKASIVGSINMAAANWQTPGAVTDAIDAITSRGTVTAHLNGWTPERRDLEQGQALTTLHKQVLQNIVQESPDQAQAYFDHYKEQILGTERDGIQRVIKGAKFTTTSQAFGDQVIASGMTEGDAVAAARAKFSGAEEDQVVLEVKTRFHEVSTARENMQKDAADTAFGIYARTGRISAIPQPVLDKLDGRVLLSLKHEAEAKAQGGAVKTDPTTFYALRTMAAQDPDTFARQDLRAYKGKLSEASFEQFADMQQQVVKPKQQAEVATLDKQLSTTHELLGWGGDTSGIKQKGAFDQAVMQELSALQTQVKRPLTYEERQLVIDRNAIQRDNAWSQFGQQRFFEVKGTPDAVAFVPKVPDNDRAAIVANFRAKNIANPTDDQIVAAYRKWKGL